MQVCAAGTANGPEAEFCGPRATGACRDVAPTGAEMRQPSVAGAARVDVAAAELAPA
jgi:hypothetical protein